MIAHGLLRHSFRCKVVVPLNLSGCAPCLGDPNHGVKALILHAFACQAAELPVLPRAQSGPSCTVQKHGPRFGMLTEQKPLRN